MINVDDWIKESDLFPMILENFTKKLEFSALWIKLTGELFLTNGLLTHFTSVERSGNAIMSYDQNNSSLRITTSASIQQISVSTLMNLM